MQLRAPWLEARLPLMASAGWDALVVPLSYGLVYLWHHGNWPQGGLAVPIYLCLWLAYSYLIGRYSKKADRLADKPNRWLLLLLLILLLLTTILGGAWLLQFPMTVTALRSQQLPFLFIASFGSWLGQFLLIRKGNALKPWLVVANSAEEEVLQKLQLTVRATHWNLIQLEQSNEAELTKFQGVAISEQLPLSLENLQELMAARSQGFQCTNLVSWCEAQLQRVPPELFCRETLLLGEGFQLQPGSFSWRLKRSADLIVASSLLLIAIPILLVSAILIKLQDGGPILYCQVRSGLYGKKFKLAKLRSMRVDAEDGGARWASPVDQRITPLGYWLRRTRIDELPQLWAVLRGDMSLIGPRPERPEFEAELEKAIPHYRLRHWLRPGLSGWAQVCHPYGASVADAHEKLSYDLYYLRNGNALLDCLILIKTIRLVLLARGAIPLDPSPQFRHNQKS
jgi:lipopolysaccharide/colanic/teichoic acid biosynthesis glycosyltransferase